MMSATAGAGPSSSPKGRASSLPFGELAVAEERLLDGADVLVELAVEVAVDDGLDRLMTRSTVRCGRRACRDGVDLELDDGEERWSPWSCRHLPASSSVMPVSEQPRLG
jgi:hypothetical protein